MVNPYASAGISSGVTLITTVIGYVWKLSARLTRIEDQLNVILTNHLPHLEAAIRRADKRNAIERKTRKSRKSRK